MPRSVTRKLIDAHLVGGTPSPGQEIALRIDQTLTQDATGTLVMLELEAMGLDRVATELSAQYVDHNLVQEDYKNADDHLFLRSACQRFGIWYSRPGNGVSHPVHMERFGKPGKTLLGSDSHTCAAGALGMLAIGSGGLEVALAMSGEPFHVQAPAVWGVRLDGALPPWVSAKDVILEMLRRHGVAGGLGRVVEYYGPGLAALGVWDRHVIANMGAELGATTTVFPSDAAVGEFLASQRRAGDWVELVADPGADWDVHDAIDLAKLEPLIAKPQSPGNVVAVRDVAGEEIYQSYIGSSANPGYRDFAIAAAIVRGRRVPDQVSLDVAPTSRAVLEDMVRSGVLLDLLHAGARVHQAGCNGCIGMGQAPASGRNSLRTVPRNFPGRSGTPEDSVFLCSPETAAASALRGAITDPRDLGVPWPAVTAPRDPTIVADMLLAPLPPEQARDVALVKGPNIRSLPELHPLPDSLRVPVVLAVGDDVSTDEILPAGARVLPFRSNVQAIAEFCFEPVDRTYPRRAKAAGAGGHAIVAGRNYGQGSSREHAALAPRYLGLRLVIARSFARIHWQNLVNFGVLPLTIAPGDAIAPGDVLVVEGLHAQHSGDEIRLRREGKSEIVAKHALSPRQVEVVRAGGLLPWVRQRRRA